MQYLSSRYSADDDRAAFAAHCEAELPMRPDIAYLDNFTGGTLTASCSGTPLWSVGFSAQHTTITPRLILDEMLVNGFVSEGDEVKCWVRVAGPPLLADAQAASQFSLSYVKGAARMTTALAILVVHHEHSQAVDPFSTFATLLPREKKKKKKKKKLCVDTLSLKKN
eukprot:NODE_24129_length_637_cov_2.931373.p1 GENE.NODE_24129_length_637_cov_2.931373~~NODE_24129_length_637_cov_2.931373.p1  ORF type:complete len:167 (-),score=49.00 NODE_24129_length_637_cov_2.931373:137-637(-)